MKKAKHKVGDTVTVVRLIYIYSSHARPQDVFKDSIKSISDGKITTKSGLVFNASTGFKVKDRSTFIKEIRFTS